MASTFDTLAAARELAAAGIEQAHAEAIAATMRRAAGAEHDHLATKADVAEVRAELAEFRGEVRTELRMQRWLLGFMAALMLAMAGKLFGIV